MAQQPVPCVKQAGEHQRRARQHAEDGRRLQPQAGYLQRLLTAKACPDQDPQYGQRHDGDDDVAQTVEVILPVQHVGRDPGAQRQDDGHHRGGEEGRVFIMSLHEYTRFPVIFRIQYIRRQSGALPPDYHIIRCAG